MLTAVAWISWGWSLFAAIALALGMAVAVGLFNGLHNGDKDSILHRHSRLQHAGVRIHLARLRFGDLFPAPARTGPGDEPGAGRPLPWPEQSGPAVRTSDGRRLDGRHRAGFRLSARQILFGFRLKAIGGNSGAAKFARIPVTRYKIWAFIICSMSAAVAGILASPSSVRSARSRHRVAVPDLRRRRHRRRQLTWGPGTVVGTLLGCLLLAILNNGLALMAAGASCSRSSSASSPSAPWFVDQATRSWRRDSGTVATRASPSPIWSRPTGTPSLSRGSPCRPARARSSALPGRTAPARARWSRSWRARQCRTPARSPSTARDGMSTRIASCRDRASGAAAVSQPHRRGEHSRRGGGHGHGGPRSPPRTRRCWPRSVSRGSPTRGR